MIDCEEIFHLTEYLSYNETKIDNHRCRIID
jgi:hypothetical protein